MTYLTVKWLHILSATFMFGTGFGTAFYMFFVNRSKNVQAMAVVTRWVVRADTWITAPAVVFQPLSGLYMMHAAGYPPSASWLWISLSLYALAGACWLPVLWLQWRMRDMAGQAAQALQTSGGATDAADATGIAPRYWLYERIWVALGFPAFGGLLVVYWLMVSKPA
ncbi:DUF2269 family protein [Cupriavidus basilensis]|uniref:DUF2269 family protein n=1 Tax=Cupriavidus basilensis TaxID=68895 RepID=UPI0020A654A8|nr:DUF2269 domain-containing protein [Cupriavidus basilensis]MCP3019484.1 DUF2269 domain-containing protein [Cupriavidus basilensis]